LSNEIGLAVIDFKLYNIIVSQFTDNFALNMLNAKINTFDPYEV